MPLANIALTDTFDTWRVRTNQIIIALDQANTITYSSIANTGGGFNKANSANLLAFNVSIGSNSWANTVGASVNSNVSVVVSASSNGWANIVGAAANNRSVIIGSSVNNYVAFVALSSNSYVDGVIGTVTGSTSANSYANTIGVISNNWSNTISLSVNNYTLSVISNANSYANVVGTRSNTWASYVGNSANNYANYVGNSSNGYTSTVIANANALSNAKLANTPGVTFAGDLYFPASTSLHIGTGSGSLWFSGNQIGSGWYFNGSDSGISVNYTGFNGGSSHFRSIQIFNGKTSPIALFNGSDRNLYVYGDVQAYYASDAILKENITIIPDALTKVNSIRGVEFDWTDEHLNQRGDIDEYFNRKHDIGVIAQEIEKVLPEAVATRDNGTKAVKYDRIIPLLIEAIKELSKQIDDIKKDK